MGDTLEYIEGECEDWAEEVPCLLAEGYSREEALKIAGEPPLPDCWEFIVDVNAMIKDEEK
ncbi:MAG: hypothetical protein QMC78_06495, partial [Methanocellales archaeon]|nr:hypothetical protein [Methanocellales archaeon]